MEVERNFPITQTSARPWRQKLVRVNERFITDDVILSQTKQSCDPPLFRAHIIVNRQSESTPADTTIPQGTFRFLHDEIDGPTSFFLGFGVLTTCFKMAVFFNSSSSVFNPIWNCHSRASSVDQSGPHSLLKNLLVRDQKALK
jgi:hypothetical protein